MFESVPTAPPDTILGLTEAFLRDERPHKINLSVGVYKDASGATPILEVVKEAERRLLATEKSKGYKPISGDPAYGRCVRELLFGAGSELASGDLAATCHTPGGTGALRLAADYLRQQHSGTKIWLSDPTWDNHGKVFKAAGLECGTYPYFDAAKNGLAFEAMVEGLSAVRAGDTVLLHACCHNPTGVDPTPEQWQQLGALLRERGALPLVDFAYQGFGRGVDEDAVGVRALVDAVDELLICSSFSKNFGLYNERTGALTVKGKRAEEVAAVFSQLKTCARTNYSNPPAHGGAIVTTILTDAELRQRWIDEVAGMRDRINGMRQLFVETLAARGATRDFSFIVDQKGMFSFSGLTKAQVERLRDEHAIYIVGSGRINVAGMTETNMGPLCDAIVQVM
ncbi:MAG: aspartate/tyrosine/aromatic aminotransferase [Myxococcales bacterium]|nr:aspartate/tyrosine/aromatic aminotransferase [Myxococcales bacterium]